jgi:hypothetical protein
MKRRTMKRFMNKKVAAIGLAAGLVLGVGGAAFAYWTTSGSGNGTATTQSSNGTLALNVSADSSQLYPGGSAPVTITATNNGATDLYVTTVSFASLSVDAAHAAAGCLASDYSVGSVSTTPTDVLAGTTSATVATATLSMANTALNQDACEGATITLNFTSV